jgi:hypothetical protein
MTAVSGTAKDLRALIDALQGNVSVGLREQMYAAADRLEAAAEAGTDCITLPRPELPEGYERVRFGCVSAGRSLTMAGMRVQLSQTPIAPLGAADARALAAVLAAFADEIDTAEADGLTASLSAVIRPHLGSGEDCHYERAGAIARAIMAAGLAVSGQ